MSNQQTPGTIATGLKEYTVICAACLKNYADYQWTLKDAHAAFRLEGWSYKRNGWTCPDCVNQTDKQESEA